MLLDPILLQKFVLLLIIHNNMLWHKIMLSDVDLQVVDLESFKSYFGISVFFLAKGCLLSANHDSSISAEAITRNIYPLDVFAIGFLCFDAPKHCYLVSADVFFDVFWILVWLLWAFFVVVKVIQVFPSDFTAFLYFKFEVCE